jgi:predicted TIM-barrel fold metal-dependent hydrolase
MPSASTSGHRRPYRLVSADQHVNEPPDLWTNRVAAKFKDRVPKMKSFEQGDAWIIEGVTDPINFGLNSCAGMAAEDVKSWMHWSQVRRGGYIGAERLKEMETDGVDAAMMFPTPRLSIGVMTNPDRELHLAMVRAYNDWLAEYVSAAPDRLFGLPMLPASGVRDAIDEMHRCLAMPGMIGPLLACYPHGDAKLSPEDDPLWAAVVEAKVPLTIHVSLADAKPAAHGDRIPGDTRNWDASRRMLELMWGGVLDRFPELKVVFTEVDAGWVPFFKEQVDNRFHRLAKASRFGLRMAPSEYFDRHYHYVFVSDSYALQNRHAVGVDNLMWSDDYPHMGGDWPYTQRTLTQTMVGIPREEKEKILAGNAVRLYRLPGLAA